MKKLDPKIIDILKNGTVEQRKYICEAEPLYFMIYYFTEYFTYPLAPFHFDFNEDIKDLTNNKIKEAAWIAFRESAKSSFGKVGMACWNICYKKKRYISWDAYDKENAEAALFDVAVALQTNQKILQDFGHLYHKKKEKDALVESKLKRISNFITENDVRVSAFSTQESTRGRVYKEKRPDLYILDDIETSKTRYSLARTQSIIDHIDEMKSGLAPDGSILYLGNYITEEGVIAHVMNRIEQSGSGRIRFIPVIKDKKPTWPGKYVMTDKEAVEVNKNIKDKKLHKISLEAKERELGQRVFATEMMNDPGASGDYVFNRDKIKELMEKTVEPWKNIAGFKMWDEYNPKHVYSGGADTSEGIEGDANADAIIDTTRRPALVVATYANNKINPTVFAHAIRNHGYKYGECFYVPEINNTGYATIAELINIGYLNIYQREQKHKISGQLTKEYGFKTSLGNKHDIVGHFVEAVESGELEILDYDLLKECYHFTHNDLRQTKVVEGMTRHFDKLWAAMLAWEGRKMASYYQANDEDYKSPLTVGEYPM